MTVFHSELRGGEYAELRKPVPAAAAKIGDTVVSGGQVYVVTAVDDYAPGEHDWSPVANCLAARCVTMGSRERWFGHRVGDAYRGAEIISRYPAGIVFGH